MSSSHSLIATIYAAFNRRDPDGAFAHMTETVSWPKASEGGRVTGKDAIRDYWLRQWQTFDPHVEPLAVEEPTPGHLSVRVHQVVRDTAGELLADAEVLHRYTLRGGLVDRMDLGDTEEDTPSSAFTHTTR